MIRTKLIGIALCGLVLLGGTGVASAASWPDRDRDRRCEERIEHRQHELDGPSGITATTAGKPSINGAGWRVRSTNAASRLGVG